MTINRPFSPFYYLNYSIKLDKCQEKWYNFSRERIKVTNMCNKFYDGTKLMSLKDINGNEPEIYLCTTNRSGGKTVFFSRYFVKKYLNTGSKFMLIYRFNYELTDIAEKFFKDIKGLFFNEYVMTAERKANGIYYELFIQKGEGEKKSCGYAVSINNADQIKKCAHLFSDTDRMLFDEFQSETNHYCNNEVTKFISIHTSVARGGGEHVRRVPVYMLSNSVSLLNPYYEALGISDRLTKETKFLKGDGFVLEQGYVDSASVAQKSSAFNRAFGNEAYVKYSSENVYLNDNISFIETPQGDSQYILTIKYNGEYYSLRKYAKLGIIYCDNTYDKTFNTIVATSMADHDDTTIMNTASSITTVMLRSQYYKGCFRFKNLKCKSAVLKLLSLQYPC